MIVSTLSFAALVALATAHGDHDQKPIAGPHKSLWYNTLPGDGGTQVRYLGHFVEVAMQLT
jgi:agmatinase